jgi:hypothetical protein
MQDASKGPAKINRGPPWWVGRSEAKKGRGSNMFFSVFFYGVFELLSPKNAQKLDKTIEENKWIFGRFFCKNFSTRLFCKKLLLVFLKSHR